MCEKRREWRRGCASRQAIDSRGRASATAIVRPFAGRKVSPAATAPVSAAAASALATVKKR